MVGGSNIGGEVRGLGELSKILEKEGGEEDFDIDEFLEKLEKEEEISLSDIIIHTVFSKEGREDQDPQAFIIDNNPYVIETGFGKEDETIDILRETDGNRQLIIERFKNSDQDVSKWVKFIEENIKAAGKSMKNEEDDGSSIEGLLFLDKNEREISADNFEADKTHELFRVKDLSDLNIIDHDIEVDKDFDVVSSPSEEEQPGGEIKIHSKED